MLSLSLSAPPFVFVTGREYRDKRDNVYSGNVYVWGCVSVREYVRMGVHGNVRVCESACEYVYECVGMCEDV